MQILRVYSCIKCGQPYVAKRRKRSGLCDDCGMVAVRESIIAMLKKEGPYYERWKRGMEKHYGKREAGKRSLRPKR